MLTPVTFLDGGAPAWQDLNLAGDRLAFQRRTTTPQRPDVQGLYSADVQRAGTALTVGPALLLTSDAVRTTVNLSPGQPSFTHDGRSIIFTQGDARAGEASISRVTATGGPVTRLFKTFSPANLHVGSRQATAPASLTSVGPAVRRGPTATIPYTVASDPTASTVVAVRTSPGLPAKTLRAVVPNPLDANGVVSGRTYTYSLRQVDRLGFSGRATATVLRQSAPAAAVRVSGQRLIAGQLLRSANGVRLRVNPDGNLVALSPQPRGNVLLQTRTRGTNPVLRVNPDGNLVLLSGSRVLWHARTQGQGTAALVVQDDGNVVLYRDRDGRAVWSSRSGRTY